MRPSSKKGGVPLVVKNNQKRLKEEIATIWVFDQASPPAHTSTTKHGDRVETRRLWVSGILSGYSDWPHIAQVCRLERIVHRRQGRTTQEWAYAVTSLAVDAASPERLLALWRGHWAIENRLHWVRDVGFDEDHSQVRTGAAPQIMAACRNLAINLIRMAGFPSIASAFRRHAAHSSEAVALLVGPAAR